MRITELAIKQFKNLRNFSIKFDADSFTTVLVGRNGSGKSNLLEALIIIFRDLDLGEVSPFVYHIVYSFRGAEIVIDADPFRSKEPVRITVDGNMVHLRDFSRKGGERYLPNYLFGYYSGPGDRMEAHFAKHQRQFADDLLYGNDQPLRPLLYARLVHSQFVLLSFFVGVDQSYDFLKKYLKIEDLESVLFVLKKPSWYSPQRRTPLHDQGDRRFWGARGVVRDFLSKLHRLALAPLRYPLTKQAKFDRLYLYLKNKQDLVALAKEYANSQEFFKALESMYISDLIQEVRTRVKIQGVDETLTFRELSEGEQQLLMVLGLLRFIKEDEALFLLDEPDTHLNPSWSLEYVRLLKEAIENAETSQIIMATHDPLVVAGLSRTEVQLMRRDANGQIFAEHPEDDPRGMGVSALLTSDVYGLRSELDLETLEMLDAKRELATIEHPDQQQKEDLARLNRYLGELDFTKTVRDPMYQLFVDAMAEVEREQGLLLPVLTKEQKDRQREIAIDVVRRLRAQEEKGR